MAGRSISSYFATVGVDIDKTGVRNVDAYLKRIERRMEAFARRSQKNLRLNTLALDRFTVDQRRLNRVVGDALDVASTRTVFQISRFHVDQINLQRALNRASRGLALPMGDGGKSGGPNRYTQAERLELENTRHRNRMEQIAARGVGTRGTVGLGLRAGPFAGALGVYGAYRGLSALNTANQEIISAQLTTQAVTEAGGAPGEGPRAFEWLRAQANRVGFSYMDAAQDYNNLLSNTLASGLSVAEGQNVFQGFSEYGRAMGVTPHRQNLVFNA